MASTALDIQGGQSNAQLTRAFERLFEEAQISGELKLSGRKLKEFPKIAAKYDLNDVVHADLSKNRFTDLPCEACEFFLLERLDCYHNLVRCIPDSIITLQSLAFLNLSRNQLSTIPPSLCQLPLQVLNLSNNKLVSLPEEIGHMSCLNDLDVSCNEIAILPPQIGDLHSLRSLNIRRNMLVEIRPEVCELRLVRLDVSGNRISILPTALRLMDTLHELYLHHNPLVSPPAFLCTRGKVHIFKYLESQSIKEDKKRGILLESEFRRSGRRLPGSTNDAKFHNGFSVDMHFKKRCTVDSGYNTSDGCDKRWSQDLQSESDPFCLMQLNSKSDESRNLTVRAAEYVRGKNAQGSPSECEALQEDSHCRPQKMDRCSESRRQYPQYSQTYKEYKEALKQKRDSSALYRKSSLEDASSSSSSQSSPRTEVPSKTDLLPCAVQDSHTSAPTRNPTDSPETSPCNGQWRHFTIRRELDREREEKELLRQMRQTIEGRLKVSLPEDVATALTDGVVLCHLANNVRPHSVATIHVPSPAVPRLSQPKCRRNVENFLEACRRIGVPEELTCRAQDILNTVDKSLVRVAATVRELVKPK